MENRQRNRQERTDEAIKALSICAWFVWGGWAILVAMKYFKLVGMSWTAVVLGGIWIPAIFLALAALAFGSILLAVRIKRWSRERKVTRRIKEQAKALGIWDKPQALGGKGLTLSAWENYGIRRKRGETDLQLRMRCMAKAEKTPTKSPKEGSGKE